MPWICHYGDMPHFTQKYTLAQLITPLASGTEFAMEDWPLHVTLADVFSITGDPQALLVQLAAALATLSVATAAVVDDAWFGPHKQAHVMLLERTPELLQLHETVVRVLEAFAVQFNAPQHVREGFRPHSTMQGRTGAALQLGDAVRFDALTLIDMFPDEKAYRRRVIGTVRVGRS